MNVKDSFEEYLVDVSKNDPVCEEVLTLPGIKTLLAATYLAAVSSVGESVSGSDNPLEVIMEELLDEALHFEFAIVSGYYDSDTVDNNEIKH